MALDFSTIPTITTERLVLRELQPTDAADIFVFRSDPEVQKYNAEPMKEVAEAEAFVERNLAAVRDQELLLWGLAFRDEDRVLGMVSFSDWSQYHHRAMIGYDLARAYWGQGIGSEAVTAVIRFGFEQMALNRIEAITIADNAGSVRMLERLGFRREGRRRAYSLEDDGLYHDSLVFGLLRSEFAR